MDTLSLAEASVAAGVPAVQLKRWAWEDWDVYQRRASGQVGPRNVGTRNNPLYLEQDVREWRARAGAGRQNGLLTHSRSREVSRQGSRFDSPKTQDRSNTIRQRTQEWP